MRVYGYAGNSEMEITPYIPQSIDIMAIDNLRNKVPRIASEEFGALLIKSVWG